MRLSVLSGMTLAVTQAFVSPSTIGQDSPPASIPSHRILLDSCGLLGTDIVEYADVDHSPAGEAEQSAQQYFADEPLGHDYACLQIRGDIARARLEKAVKGIQSTHMAPPSEGPIIEDHESEQGTNTTEAPTDATLPFDDRYREYEDMVSEVLPKLVYIEEQQKALADLAASCHLPPPGSLVYPAISSTTSVAKDNELLKTFKTALPSGTAFAMWKLMNVENRYAILNDQLQGVGLTEEASGRIANRFEQLADHPRIRGLTVGAIGMTVAQAVLPSLQDSAVPNPNPIDDVKSMGCSDIGGHDESTVERLSPPNWLLRGLTCVAIGIACYWLYQWLRRRRIMK